MNADECRILLVGCLIGVSSPAWAEWQRLGGTALDGRELFMDPQSVKQAGPMAIYRQVQVLSQGPGRSAPGAASTTTLYEYNCMSSQVRVLQMLAFDKPWAAGNPFELPPPPAMAQWHLSAEPLLAQPMVDMLCPSGVD